MLKGLNVLSFFILLMIRFSASQADASAADAAIRFQKALAACDWAQAAEYCIDGSALLEWSPPAVTREIVYPSIKDVRLRDISAEDGETIVTLSLSAIDLSSEDFLLLALEQFGLKDLYQKESGAHPLRDPGAAVNRSFAQAPPEHRRTFSVPYVLRQTGGEWRIDLSATLARWPGEPQPRITAVSYGEITNDAAQLQYYLNDLLYADAIVWPEEMDWSVWLNQLAPAQVFGALGVPERNIWLRLTADQPAENLVDFEWVGGACEPSLEIHYDYDTFSGYGCIARRWAAYGDTCHAVLMASLPHAIGAPLDGHTLRCRRCLNILSPMYKEDHVEILLNGVPFQMLPPENGIHFTVDHFMRMREGEYKLGLGDKTQVTTLGQLLRYEYEGDGYDSVWLDIPEEAADLPVTNDRYALYRLQGTAAKAAGDFGVYDVMFKSVAGGVWIEAYERCGMCEAIDGFDLPGGDSTLTDTLQAPFDVLVLLPINGRSEAELENALRSLSLTATFSAEKIDFCYVQHGTTTRIGPRSSVKVDLSQMRRWEDGFCTLPRAKRVFSKHPDDTKDGTGQK